MLTACVVAAGSTSDSGGLFLFVLVPLAMVFLMAGLARARRHEHHRAGRSQSFAYGDDTVNGQVLRAELSVLADDVIRLEPRVALNEAARDDFEAATHRYRVAQAALDYAKEPIDLVRVQRVVDEANWSMSRARAVLDGRSPPAPPSQLQRPGPHGEPAVRVDQRRGPVYVDSPEPFRSGWFSAGGGLFGGLLLGSVLGGFGGEWIVQEDSDEFEADGGDEDPSDW
jgi:hypothetical protein